MTKINYEFKGECPSYKQVLKKAKELVVLHGECEISWGENCINIMENPSYNAISGWNTLFIGYGWIRNISGERISLELS